MVIKSYKRIETQTGNIGLVEIEENGKTFYKIGVANLGSDDSDQELIAEHGTEVSDSSMFGEINDCGITIDYPSDPSMPYLTGGGFGGFPVYGGNMTLPDPDDD